MFVVIFFGKFMLLCCEIRYFILILFPHFDGCELCEGFGWDFSAFVCRNSYYSPSHWCLGVYDDKRGSAKLSPTIPIRIRMKNCAPWFTLYDIFFIIILGDGDRGVLALTRTLPVCDEKIVFICIELIRLNNFLLSPSTKAKEKKNIWINEKRRLNGEEIKINCALCVCVCVCKSMTWTQRATGIHFSFLLNFNCIYISSYSFFSRWL